MNARLIAISGPEKGREFPFKEKETAVGRAEANDIVLNDELASRRHFAFWREGDKLCFRDLDTRNGTWVDGEPRPRGELQEGSRIKCGITIFVCAIQDKVPEKLLTVIDSEITQNTNLETLRADYSSIEDLPSYYRGGLRAALKMGGCLNAIQDPYELQSHLLDLILNIIPARRGAVLINGKHVSPDPSDFILEVYRDDAGLDARFPVNSRLVADVYKAREALMPKSMIPPTICAPLLSGGLLKGALYLEGVRGASAFEPEHLQWAADLADTVAGGLRESRQVESIRHERDALKAERESGNELVGESEALQTVLEKIEVAADSDIPVLITGQTGTGKEAVARLIHAKGSRAGKAFVAVNCPAISEGLFESEFFGHVKGSFTGATESRDGKFKLADNGTLLLDEIGELKLDKQPKLLRVLQDYEFEPVGATRTVKVDVRVIASTNVDLEEAVRNHTFRLDLYERLKDMTIVVPPLRDRREDIPLLVDHFVAMYGLRRGVSGIAPDALKAIMSYDFPGNVRELKSLVRSGVEFARAGKASEIRLKDLPAGLAERKIIAVAAAERNGPKKARAAALDLLRADAVKIFAETQSAKESAKRLGITEGYLYRLLREAKSKER
jgi:transcriptional regulator with GAF, ATPase, and Fis domain